MRITVIGAGNVGGTLGRRWAELGHEVVFGLRDPSKGADGVHPGGPLPKGARVASIPDALRSAEVVLLATPWDVTLDAVAKLPLPPGVVLIDATNPLGPGLSWVPGPHGESGGERVQSAAPHARVVKAFNTTGYENMRDPSYDGAPSLMPYAGDDAAAKQVVHELAAALGFDAVDAGPLVRSRQLENVAVLWIAWAIGIGVKGMGRGIALQLVRR